MRQRRIHPGLPRALLVLVLASASQTVAVPLRADGGTLRVANVRMGAYRVSVFTDPTPIRPDSIDVSILVTLERGRGVPPGLEILVVARHLGDGDRILRRPATREQAEDPRYYAAKFAPGAVGEWEILVRIRGEEGAGETRFRVQVQEPGPLHNPFLILAAALIPLVLVGWWLKRTEGTSPDPAVS
jgi:hypothetical protein